MKLRCGFSPEYCHLLLPATSQPAAFMRMITLEGWLCAMTLLVLLAPDLNLGALTCLEPAGEAPSSGYNLTRVCCEGLSLTATVLACAEVGRRSCSYWNLQASQHALGEACSAEQSAEDAVLSTCLDKSSPQKERVAPALEVLVGCLW